MMVKVSGIKPMMVYCFPAWRVEGNRYFLEGQFDLGLHIRLEQGEIYTLRFPKSRTSNVAGHGFFNLKMKLIALAREGEKVDCTFVFEQRDHLLEGDEDPET